MNLRNKAARKEITVKKTFWIWTFMLISLLALSACSGSAPQPQTTPNAPAEPLATQALNLEIKATSQPAEPTAAYQPGKNDVCDNIYYPIVNGASWTYDLSVGGQATHTISVNADRSFTLTIQNKDSSAAMDGRCSADGIVLLDVPGVSTVYKDGEGGSTLTTNALDGVTLPNDIQLGDDWSQSISVTGTSSDGESTLSAQIDTTYTALAYEQVDTPAGTFYALKVEQIGKMTMDGNSFDTHGYIWYVQGVGPVKSSTIDGNNSSQLAAYSIP